MGIPKEQRVVATVPAVKPASLPEPDQPEQPTQTTTRSFGQWLKDEVVYRRSAISGIDNMWLKLAGGSNDFNPVCTSVCTYNDEISYEGLLDAWKFMIKRYPRYHQKLTGVGRRFHTARLVDDPTFDIHNHFSIERLPDGANGKRELEAFVSTFVAKTWNLNKPLWEGKVVYNYTDAEGAKSAVIVRAHHTLADGQGYVISQLTSCTNAPDEPLKKAIKSEAELKVDFLKRAGMWKEPSKKQVSSLVKAARKAQKAVGQALFMLFALVYGLWLSAYNWFMMLTFRPRALVYDGTRSAEKEYAFSDKISVTDIKLCQKAFKSKGRKITLNDVMSAVVAKSMTTYFAEAGEHVDRRVAFFVPLSVRMPWVMSMGNYSTGQIAYFKAPPQMSKQQLIDAAHDEMNVLKKNIWPRFLFKAVGWANNFPVFFPPDAVMGRALTGAHGVFTNVPGPGAAIYQSGTEVLRWMACPPQLGRGTLGLGMISYNGYLSWTILADKTAGPNADVAHKLADLFVKTFSEFLEEARTLSKEA